MIAKKPSQPVRPPQRAARKSRCPLCGRRPIFVSHAPRSDGHARTDRFHELCPACHRSLRDQARALLVRRRDAKAFAALALALDAA